MRSTSSSLPFTLQLVDMRARLLYNSFPSTLHEDRADLAGPSSASDADEKWGMSVAGGNGARARSSKSTRLVIATRRMERRTWGMNVICHDCVAAFGPCFLSVFLLSSHHHLNHTPMSPPLVSSHSLACERERLFASNGNLALKSTHIQCNFHDQLDFCA